LEYFVILSEVEGSLVICRARKFAEFAAMKGSILTDEAAAGGTKK
jgi:hypothetical protein